MTTGVARTRRHTRSTAHPRAPDDEVRGANQFVMRRGFAQAWEAFFAALDVGPSHDAVTIDQELPFQLGERSLSVSLMTLPNES